MGKHNLPEMLAAAGEIDMTQDESKTDKFIKPIGMLSGGSAIGAALMLAISTFSSTNDKEHITFSNKISQLRVDVTELQIRSAEHSINFRNIMSQLEKIDEKLQKIVEKK